MNKKHLNLHIKIFSTALVVFIFGGIFAMAGFGILTLAILWDLSFYYLILFWTGLFYLFSIIVYQFWKPAFNPVRSKK
jgi:hypothetical protein